MKYIIIGDTITLDNGDICKCKIYEGSIEHRCSKCYLYKFPEECFRYSCNKDWRNDNKNIIFEKNKLIMDKSYKIIYICDTIVTITAILAIIINIFSKNWIEILHNLAILVLILRIKILYKYIV